MRYERRDILTVPATEGLICHCINSVGAIGGLAAAICKLDQSAAQHMTPADGERLDMGTAILTTCDTQGIGQQVFAHCVAQQFPGSPVIDSDCFDSRRKALASALDAADGFWYAQSEGKPVLFLPYNVGCGRAGDKWAAVADELAALDDSLICQMVICVPRWAEASAAANGSIGA